MNDYYVYAYYENEYSIDPFYIGKGRDNRAYRHLEKYNRKNLKSRFYDKLNSLLNNGIRPEIVFLEQNLIEQEAFNSEIKWIKYYKEIQDYDILTNYTDGGEGSSGRICSEETKQKLKEINLINLYNIGREHSYDSRLKMSISLLHRSKDKKLQQKLAQQIVTGKSICCYDLQTNKIIHIFISKNEAVKKGFNLTSIWQVLTGRIQKYKGYGWRELTEIERENLVKELKSNAMANIL